MTKLTVRDRPAECIAVRTPVDRLVILASGRTLQALAGEWLITQGKIVLDVVTDGGLARGYEIVMPSDCRVPAATCDRLEQTLGLGATRTPEALLGAVERLAAISIGTIKVEFTPGQLEEIAARSKKRGRTVEQELKAVVDRIKDDLFWRG